MGEGPSEDNVLARIRADRVDRESRLRHQVTAYFIRRLLLVIPTFLGITMAVFVVMHFVPGGPDRAPDHRVQDGGGH